MPHLDILEACLGQTADDLIDFVWWPLKIDRIAARSRIVHSRIRIYVLRLSARSIGATSVHRRNRSDQRADIRERLLNLRPVAAGDQDVA